MLQHCNEPFAKHCRLCRIRRMNALEFHMLQDDIPDEKVTRVPGCLPLIAPKAEAWSADDEKYFTFDFTRAQVKKQIFKFIFVCVHE